MMPTTYLEDHQPHKIGLDSNVLTRRRNLNKPPWCPPPGEIKNERTELEERRKQKNPIPWPPCGIFSLFWVLLENLTVLETLAKYVVVT